MNERNAFERLAALLADYLETSTSESVSVNNYLPLERLHEAWNWQLATEGTDEDTLFAAISDFLATGSNTRHPLFFNQLWARYEPAALLGELITAVVNTSMYTYEMAPIGTQLELELIERMGRMVGFEHPEGQFVTGGSNANAIALLAARNHAFPAAKTHGLKNLPQLRFYVSEESHYSFDRAANLLGLGECNKVVVPANRAGQLEPSALEALIAEDIAAGYHPFFVTATAGTTVLGAFDPIPAIADIAQQYGLWLHVDASWGGGAFLTPKIRAQVFGAERANSLTWNPHKTMGQTLVCSAILMREPGSLFRAIAGGNTEYIFHDESSCDLGRSSLQCGRRVDALKLWLTWKYLGDEGLRQRTEHLLALAAHAEAYVKAHPKLELLAPRPYLNINFRYVPIQGLSQAVLNEINLAARQRLLEGRKAMVNYSYLRNGDLTVRLILTNATLSTENVERFFELFLAAAETVQEERLAAV